MEQEKTSLNGCFLDLHYSFDDGSHTMDAILQNKCERKFLLIVDAIAKACRAHVEVEIEPRLTGGLLNRYRIKDLNPKQSNRTKLSDSVKVALLTSVFLAPTTIVVNSINEVVKSIVSGKTKDHIKDDLEKEKLQLEIEKLKREIDNQGEEELLDDTIDAVNERNERVAIEDFRRQLRKVSQKATAIDNRLKFYKLVAKYPKISNISTQVLKAGKLDKTPEFSVERQELFDIANDMSDALKEIDQLSELWGGNDYRVLRLKQEVTKRIDKPKTNDQD